MTERLALRPDRRLDMVTFPASCPVCGKQGWHMAWCPNGPGPSPRMEAGIGTGRSLSRAEVAKQEMQKRLRDELAEKAKAKPAAPEPDIPEMEDMG